MYRSVTGVQKGGVLHPGGRKNSDWGAKEGCFAPGVHPQPFYLPHSNTVRLID